MENEIPLEATLDVPDIVRFHGYDCEELTVTTVDGFILSVFRVRHLDHINEKTVKEPVVLQHGLLGCASHWVSNGPHDSLGISRARFFVCKFSFQLLFWQKQVLTSILQTHVEISTVKSMFR